MIDNIIAIGRHRFYPYACLFLVTLAFLYTNPFYTVNWRYVCSYFGAITGLVCTILLAKRRNSGNVMGMFAAVGESSGNFLGGNVGAASLSFYYFITHIYGLVTWRSHQNQQHQVTTRHLSERGFFYTLLFIIAASFFNIWFTGSLAVENDPYQLFANNIIFALGLIAQYLMIQRYSFNWLLWVILNLLVILLNLYTNNPIIATQYTLYLFNACYGLLEWRKGITPLN